MLHHDLRVRTVRMFVRRIAIVVNFVITTFTGRATERCGVVTESEQNVCSKENGKALRRMARRQFEMSIDD